MTGSVTQQPASAFADMVRDDLASLRRENPDRITSLYEGWALLAAGLEEFWAECRRQKQERSYWSMALALVRVAALSQRVAEDTGLVPGRKP